MPQMGRSGFENGFQGNPNSGGRVTCLLNPYLYRRLATNRMESEQAIDLRYYLKVLQRRRWLIVAALAAAVAAAALVTWRLTPIFEGTAKVEIRPASTSSDGAAAFLESLDPTRGLETQAELIRSRAVLGLAATELGLPSPEDLEESVSVQLLPDTQIVEIKVEHERPDEARDWTNAVASAYIDFRRERALEASLAARQEITEDVAEAEQRLAEIDEEIAAAPQDAASLSSTRDRILSELAVLEAQLRDLPEQQELLRGGGTIISEAQTPTEPVRPRKTLNLMLATVVGAMLGLGLAFLAEQLDDSLKSSEEVEALLGTPILGYVPLVKEWVGQHRQALAMSNAATSGAAEAYRTLRTNLSFIALERPLKTLLVTGPVAEVGKSTSSANLAATLAIGGSKVILISADLRRPNVHKFFGLSNSKGLMDALREDHPLWEDLQNTDIPTFKVLAAGGLPPNPTEILASGAFGRILAQLRDLSDYVVIDAPPVLGLGDTGALASRTDGVLFVLRPGQVTKREAAHAADQIRKAGGRLIGCLLNGVQADEGYGYYYHYYYSQYQPEPNGHKPDRRTEERGAKEQHFD